MAFLYHIKITSGEQGYNYPLNIIPEKRALLIFYSCQEIVLLSQIDVCFEKVLGTTDCSLQHVLLHATSRIVCGMATPTAWKIFPQAPRISLQKSARPYLKQFLDEQKVLKQGEKTGKIEPKQGGLEDGRDKNSVSNDLSVVEREAGVASSVRTAKSGKAIQEQSEETVSGVERGGTKGGELSTPSGQEGVGPGSDRRDSDAERGTHGRGSSGVSDTGRPGGQHSGVGDGTAGGRSGREETGTDEYNGRNHRINPDDEIVP